MEQAPEGLRELMRSALAKGLTTGVAGWWDANQNGWHNGWDYYY